MSCQNEYETKYPNCTVTDQATASDGDNALVSSSAWLRMKRTMINMNLNWFIFPLALVFAMTSAEIAAVAFCVLGTVYSAIKGGKTRWMILLYCGFGALYFF